MSQDMQLKLLFKPEPANILRIAWSESGKYTTEVDEKETAQNAELSFNAVKDLLLRENDPILTQYAYSLESSLLSASRTFAMIIRHRDYRFGLVEERKTNELDMYKSLQSFSAKLQSIFPRLSGMAVAGTTLPLAINQTLLTYLGMNLPLETLTLAITGFGALGYFVAEIGSSRIANKKMMETKEKYDFQKEQIYQEFLQRSKLVLSYLLNDIVSSYKRIIDSSYSLTEKEKAEIVDNCIASALPLNNRK
jgi:hypothetical protein